MKVSLLGRSIILMIALLFVLGSISPASSAPEARVWVEYQKGHQDSVKTTLQQSGAKFHYQFENLNSFVVSLPENALSGILRNPNVISIEVDPVRELVRNMPAEVEKVVATDAIIPGEQVVPYGIDMVQARDIWDANKDGKIDKKAPTGEGRKVCIIDTGYFSGHEDLPILSDEDGYSQTNDDEELWKYDGYGHGTHVAGTIAALNNDYGVVGVTPGTVSLYIVKIFGDDGAWVSIAHASDLVAAAYECADNGANVISMSLSGTHGSPYEERAFNNIYDAGILSVGAASNDGIEEYHYPASYDSVISVAALDENMLIADFSQFNDQVELAAPGVGVLSTTPNKLEAKVEVDGTTYFGLPMEFAPYGEATGELVDGGLCLKSDEPQDWSEKVVLCARGEVSFLEKVTKVQDQDGVAAIIYNNAEGLFSGTLGEPGDYIVAISVSQADGSTLLEKHLESSATVSSSIIEYYSNYEAWDGTSMATPHVSGVAALIWSANPDWTNVQIREAMAMSALDLGDVGRDVHYGYGLVQAYDALQLLGGGKPGKK